MYMSNNNMNKKIKGNCYYTWKQLLRVAKHLKIGI